MGIESLIYEFSKLVFEQLILNSLNCLLTSLWEVISKLQMLRWMKVKIRKKFKEIEALGPSCSKLPHCNKYPKIGITQPSVNLYTRLRPQYKCWVKELYFLMSISSPLVWVFVFYVYVTYLWLVFLLVVIIFFGSQAVAGRVL